MGEILSTIGSWISSRYEKAKGALKATLGVVKSVIDRTMQLVSRVVNAICYTREREWVQSETTGAEGDTRSTRVEVCLPSLTILIEYFTVSLTNYCSLPLTTNLRIPL